MLTRRAASGHAGFSLIEMLITMVVMALLVGLAMPSMSAWIRNSRLRAATDSLQDGLRLAQAEAVRRSRQVVFSLTDAKPTASGYTAIADGKNWAIQTVTTMTSGEVNAFVEAGVLTELDSNITIDGPASICFNSVGRLVANATPATNAGACELPTSTGSPPPPPLHSYDIQFSNAVAGVDRRLRVTVALGGQVRLCDRDKTLSATNPDGCP